MSTELKNKGKNSIKIPNAENMRFAIIVAEWNKNITSKLLDGALSALRKAHCTRDDIMIEWVPGTLELPMAAQICSETLEIDAIIALGCVIRGDTPHFDYVCKGAFEGLMKVQLENDIPITFGILTTEDQQQAIDRAGGKLGNKGFEAAVAAIRMAEMQFRLEDEGAEDFSIPDFDDDDDDFGIHKFSDEQPMS